VQEARSWEAIRRERWDTAVRGDLVEALTELRSALGWAAFPLELPGAAVARVGATMLSAQLDDYLIPRLQRIDAPLLAVVGGSTGAGKSTLVNSLVRAPVSTAGALRPTTRGPVLVCHPGDGAWFNERTLLSGLARSTRAGDQVLQVVSAPLLTPGVALLDAPDIDSVVAANRALALELFGAADLWLFVTTATRYADAVPWEVLRGARDRGTAVAVVLDRVPPDARDEVRADLARMLTAQRLGDAPLFVVNESTLDGHGLVGEVEVRPIKVWLDMVASSAPQRNRITRRTLLGAVTAAGPQVESLAEAADDQVRAAMTVAGVARDAFTQAMSGVESSLRSGAMLRGEVYRRWQELVAGGELRTALRLTAGADRTRLSTATIIDRPPPGRKFLAALAGSLATLISEADMAAAEQVRSRWRAHAAGRDLLAGDVALGRPWAGFTDAAHDLVHSWQTWLKVVVRTEAPRVRTSTRSYRTASTLLLGTIAAVAPTADEITAVGVAPSALRDVVRNQTARSFGERARAELLLRVGDLLGLEVQRHLSAVSAVGVNPGLAATLRDSATRLGMAQSAFATLDDAA
jgi:hypothetical protein